MGKRSLLSVVVAGFLLVGITGIVYPGIEPSPFEPEINKLHSIELQVAAINKRIAKLDEFEILPEGTTNYLNAMANQMEGIRTKLEEVLPMLQSPTLGGAYIGQDEAVYALDSIRVDSKDTYGILERIVSRMGVEPSPFLPLFNDVSRNIIEEINFHLLPVLDPIVFRPILPLP